LLIVQRETPLTLPNTAIAKMRRRFERAGQKNDFCAKQTGVDRILITVSKKPHNQKTTCYKSNTNKKTAAALAEPVDNSGKAAVSNLRLFSITDSVRLPRGGGGHSFDFLFADGSETSGNLRAVGKGICAP
jgi:hypothetical protein